MDRLTRKTLEAAQRNGGRSPLWEVPDDLDHILFVTVSRRGRVAITTIQFVWEGARSRGHEHEKDGYSLFAGIPGKKGLFPVRIESVREPGGLVMMVYDTNGELLWRQPAD